MLQSICSFTYMIIRCNKKWSFLSKISSVIVTFTEEILNGKLYFLCSNLFTPFIKIPLLFLPNFLWDYKFFRQCRKTENFNVRRGDFFNVAKAELFNVAKSQCSNVTKSGVFKCLLRIVKSQYRILICCILNLLDLK